MSIIEGSEIQSFPPMPLAFIFIWVRSLLFKKIFVIIYFYINICENSDLKFILRK